MVKRKYQPKHLRSGGVHISTTASATNRGAVSPRSLMTYTAVAGLGITGTGLLPFDSAEAADLSPQVSDDIVDVVSVDKGDTIIAVDVEWNPGNNVGVVISAPNENIVTTIEESISESVNTNDSPSSSSTDTVLAVSSVEVEIPVETTTTTAANNTTSVGNSSSSSSSSSNRTAVVVPGDVTGEAIVETALSLTGVPYVYAGSTPAGFDCSGFTQYVYAQYGISLPRTSYAQGQVGTVVSAAEAQPGDLVWHAYGHVGIYIGNGQVVEANTYGTTTRVNNLWGTYSFIRIID